MRELELASVRMDAVTFDPRGKGCGTCTINLPVSKTDVMALGKRRTHGCCCDDDTIRCPVLAAKNLVQCQEARHPNGGLNHLRPIVTTSGGNPVSKIGIQRCLQAMSERLGLGRKPTAHGMRGAGARAMAQAGLELWRIQLFLRWGSGAVLGYLQDAPLATSATISSQVARGLDLKAVKDDIAHEVQLGGRVKEEDIIHRIRDIVNDILESLTIGDGISKGDFVYKAVRGASAPPSVDPGPKITGQIYIKNDHPQSQVVHLARNEMHTVCGWLYRDAPWAKQCDERPAKPMRACRQCKVQAL